MFAIGNNTQTPTVFRSNVLVVNGLAQGGSGGYAYYGGDGADGRATSLSQTRGNATEISSGGGRAATGAANRRSTGGNCRLVGLTPLLLILVRVHYEITVISK